jgi:uncharacterized protein (TIGR03382 family)
MLSVPRFGHTATLLADGRVLVVGGSSGTETASAEIYDPATNAWMATAPMAHARRYHTATLLPDNTVLVVGGVYTESGVKTYLASAEVYDPATGTWDSAPPIQTERAYHRASLLADGRVLVTGGLNPGDLDSTELYDPAQGSWTPGGRLSARRYDHAAVSLQDGGALVIGGYSSKSSTSNYTGLAERFDPVTATWSTIGELRTPRAQAAAALLDGARVLLAGGQSDVGDLDDVEIFDLRVGSRAAPSLAARRRAGVATVVDGAVLVTGGYYATALGDAVPVLMAEVWDPAAEAWRSAGSLAEGRSAHSTTRLQDGRVLVAGGFAEVVLATTELGEMPEANGSSRGCASGGASGGAAIALVTLVAVIRRRRALEYARGRVRTCS